MRKLFFISALVTVLVSCSQPNKPVDVKSELIKHNECINNLFDYLNSKNDGSLLIDSITEKYSLKFDLHSAEPLETFMQFRNVKEYDDISINTYINFYADTLNMISFVVQTIGKEKYNNLVTLYNTLDSCYRNNTNYRYNELLDFWMTQKLDKYVCIFKPTSEKDTVYMSAAIMPLSESLLKRMEDDYRQDLKNTKH